METMFAQRKENHIKLVVFRCEQKQLRFSQRILFGNGFSIHICININYNGYPLHRSAGGCPVSPIINNDFNKIVAYLASCSEINHLLLM